VDGAYLLDLAEVCAMVLDYILWVGSGCFLLYVYYLIVVGIVRNRKAIEGETWKQSIFRKWFKLAPKHRRKRKEWLGLIWDAVLFTVSTVVPMPVIWRWAMWLLCWCLFVVWMLHIEPIDRLPTRSKIMIWLLFVCAFCGFKPVVDSQWREEQAGKNEGELAGSEQTKISNQAMPIIQVGDSGTNIIQIPGKRSPLLQWFYDAGLNVELGPKGSVISTPIRDRVGNLVMQIDRNHWRIYPLHCSDKNYNKDAFEVLDNAGHVVFQVRFTDRIKLQGEWWDTQGQGRRLLITKDGRSGEIVILGPQNQHNDELIKPIFKYPSKDHWGEFNSP